MYKGKRYNFIVIGLLFIMSIVVGFSAGMTSGTGDSVSGLDDIPEDIGLVEDDDAPVLDNFKGTPVPGADANAYERLAFAFKVYKEGAGYSSYVTQTLTTMGSVQQMAFKKYRGGGYDLSEEFFKIDSALANSLGLGKNEFKSYYSDGTNMKVKLITTSSKFSFDSKTYTYNYQDSLEEFSVDNWVNEQHRSPVNSFFTTVDRNTAEVDKYDKRSDSSNYIIRVILDVTKLDSRYLTTFSANGGNGTVFYSTVLTFKISKTTGYFTSFEKVENFGSKNGPLTADVEARLKETYFTMNKSHEATIKDIASKSFAISY